MNLFYWVQVTVPIPSIELAIIWLSVGFIFNSTLTVIFAITRPDNTISTPKLIMFLTITTFIWPLVVWQNKDILRRPNR